MLTNMVVRSVRVRESLQRAQHRQVELLRGRRPVNHAFLCRGLSLPQHLAVVLPLPPILMHQVQPHAVKVVAVRSAASGDGAGTLARPRLAMIRMGPRLRPVGEQLVVDEMLELRRVRPHVFANVA